MLGHVLQLHLVLRHRGQLGALLCLARRLWRFLGALAFLGSEIADCEGPITAAGS
jgi:hypothetical protein